MIKISEAIVRSRDIRLQLILDKSNRSENNLRALEKLDPLLSLEDDVMAYNYTPDQEYLDCTALVQRWEISGMARGKCSLPEVPNGTLVILGSSPTVHKGFLLECRQFDVDVMTVGNASKFYADARYWVGLHDPSIYFDIPCNFPTACFTSGNAEDRMWCEVTKNWSKKSLGQCSNMYHIGDKSGHSSLGIAVDLAVAMGYTNIILHGVSLGLIGNTLTHAGYWMDAEEQQKQMNLWSQVGEWINSYATNLARAGIRLISTDPIAPCEQVQLMSRTSIQAWFKSEFESRNNLRKKCAPMQTGATTMARDARIVRPLTALDLRRQWILVSAALPDFKTMIIEEVLAEARQQEKQRIGCTSCRMKTLLTPLMVRWHALFLEDPEHVRKIWNKIFPETTQYTMGSETIHKKE